MSRTPANNESGGAGYNQIAQEGRIPFILQTKLNDRQPCAQQTHSELGQPAWSDGSDGSATIIVDLEERSKRRDEDMGARVANISELKQAMQAVGLLHVEGGAVGGVCEEITETHSLHRDPIVREPIRRELFGGDVGHQGSTSRSS